ncbi:MAG: Gfo/Idh/MocA family oxidoreductase [Alphaproteobacteria bacterium]|nr:Gfo/Idh/MocA family oxidoreductase [Alphaproteobacteria bacterium]
MKAAVSGCGRMGARHVQALIGLGITVVGVTDVRPESAQAVAKQHNLPDSAVFADTPSMLAATKPDFYVIATTAPSHQELVTLALNNGIKKILCEKPLATSVAACEAIIKLAAEKNADVGVNHQMRFMPQYIIPKQMMASDEFGGLQSISVSAGNFGMAMNGTHYIEMMRFMFDEGPESVSAWFDDGFVPNPRGPEFLDKSGLMVVRTQSGKMFVLSARNTQGHGMCVTFAGRYGQIMIDELAGQMYYTHRANADDRALPTTRYGQPSKTEAKPIQGVDIIPATQDMMKALIDGKGYTTAAEACLAIRTLAAAYASAEAGGAPIKINSSALDTMVFPWA